MLYAPPPRVEALSESDMPTRSGGHEDHEGITSGHVEREQVRLADAVIFGVDAQERTPHIRQIPMARTVTVVILPGVK